ncbi:hypothetical protein [Rhodopila sp.]|uniref:hypothetical protein n=1 Tax=Rhodopila sp. TaxID=2480087 RepID=UPI003D136D11
MGAQLLALMAWPKSSRCQRQVLATFAADMVGSMEENAPLISRFGQQAAFSAFVSRVGIDHDHLPFMPSTTAQIAAIIDRPHEVARAVHRDMWVPGGGYKSVADAPGTAAVVQEFSRASGGGAMHTGFLLLLVAVIRASYPSLDPSLGRAMAMLQEEGSKVGGSTVPTHRTLKEWWKEWRGISPVWAAFVLQCQLSGVPPQAAAWEAMFDQNRRFQVMGWAQWFRTFGTTFTPKHGSEPLIPGGEAVELRFDMPEQEPPLGECAISPKGFLAASSGRDGTYVWNVLQREDHSA